MSRISGNFHVGGHFSSDSMTLPAATVTNAGIHATANIDRSKMAQESLVKVGGRLTDAVVWDSGAKLAATGGSPSDDDLGLYINSTVIRIATGDVVGTSKTRKAAHEFVLPECYDAGNDVKIRVRAFTITGPAQVSCTVDVEAKEPDGDGGFGSDLCTTGAQSCNDNTAADYDFTLTSAALSPGDKIYVVVTLLIDDTGGAGAVEAAYSEISLLCDVRG